ncbi:hypothetical protein HNY42_15920 (plasmid) [Exiguobacterium sp. Helios]|uniref:hypothetical protein n=1 Tax=Exiguobacterium sp. Helios TaxID=2735868 RepID=UPI00165DB6F3|nr:hypothetical protein [Exiguobacterium sp. Helios]QNR22486.1 hypothetical protein HNY42_15920 [Exiguobacterium sp. Helios]
MKERELFTKYIGMDVDDIFREFGRNPDLERNKAWLTNLQKLMRSTVEEELQRIHEESGLPEISFRTVNLKAKTGRPIELMSLDAIDFLEWVELPWEQSKVYERFRDTLFILLVFKTDDKGTMFIGDKTWTMPEDVLQGKIKTFWVRVKKLTNDGIKDAFPKQDAGLVLHLKAKGGNSAVLDSLPNGDTISRHGLWMNANYIAGMVDDIYRREFPVRVRQISKVPAINEEQAIRLRRILTREGYIIDEFIAIIAQEVPGYSLARLTKVDAELLGYRLEKELAFRFHHQTASSLFDCIIFEREFLTVEEHPILQTNAGKRYLKGKLLLSQILQLSPGTYVTETCLARAGIREKDISDYRKSVEEWVDAKQFFTLSSLKDNGFKHALDDIGFEDAFYESILSRTGVLKNLRLGKSSIFVKQLGKPKHEQLMKWLMERNKSLLMDDFQLKIKGCLSLTMSEKEIVNLVNNSKHYYSKEFEKIYVSREEYLNSIYD